MVVCHNTPVRLVPALSLSALLAACAGMPADQSAYESSNRSVYSSSTPGSATEQAASKPSQQASAAKPTTQKRGGGFYKDDGPGDNPPANMADIPDAEPRAEPLRQAANKPYAALGFNFTPLTEVQPFTQRGLASWYGRRFHGAKTSSGEPYDMYAMTGAHTTLPIPSYARVTNVSNGKTVVVRINDRGPFHSNRVIDLSYTAAWKLGYADRGSAEVVVEAIVPDELDMLIADRGKTTVPFKALALDTPPTPTRSLPAAKALPTPRTVARSSTPAPVLPDATLAGATSPAAATVATSSGPGALSTPPTAAGQASPISAIATSPSSETTAVATAAPARKGFFLQLGAFSLSANAETFKEHVQHQLKWLREGIATLLVDDKYRLHVGPFNTANEARSMSDRIALALKVRPFVVER